MTDFEFDKQLIGMSFSASCCRWRGAIVSPAAVLLLAFLQLLTCQAAAHELDVDSFSIRLDEKAAQVAGQFLLDPDVTRPGGAQTSVQGSAMEKETATLFSFIQDHFVLEADAEQVQMSFSLRELYVKGGAVPGDSVMFSAQLPQGWQQLSLRIKSPLERLAVTTAIEMVEEPSVMLIGVAPIVLYESLETRAVEEESAANSMHSPATPPSFWQQIREQGPEYVWIGFIHILPLGWDHILFVIALTIGSLGRYRRLIGEVSAFTLAHTLTLALGAWQILVVPSSIVEPLIALSIAAVAAEYLVGTEKAWLRFVLIGGFGLLHGLGFAGALLDVGLSKQSFLLFLASFNLGVELGQLVVVLLCILLFQLFSRLPETQKLTQRILVLAIGVCGLCVGIARLMSEGGLLHS